MNIELAEPGADQACREARTSLFVMATIYTDSGSVPVKVRDLSAWGGLVEGQKIPGAGASVHLCRGPLKISGQIVWQHESRAGLRFDSAISVAEWLPSGRALTRQQRVDEMVQIFKGSGTAGPQPPAADTPLLPSTVNSVDLIALRIAIESLADDLAADADVVKRHMTKLQTLDLAAQALRKLTEPS